MQLSEIDRKVVSNLHNLTLDEQKSILELSLMLIKKRQQHKSEKSTQSFVEFLREFRKEVEAEPLDIDTSIFDKDRKSNVKSDKKETSTSAGEALKVFLKKYENDPIDIDTSIFDSYRKSVKERDFRWED
jgi:pyruvate-formate lyase-activating enzyme